MHAQPLTSDMKTRSKIGRFVGKMRLHALEAYKFLLNPYCSGGQ